MRGPFGCVLRPPNRLMGGAEHAPTAFDWIKGLDARGYETNESDPDRVQIPMWCRFSNLRIIAYFLVGSAEALLAKHFFHACRRKLKDNE